MFHNEQIGRDFLRAYVHGIDILEYKTEQDELGTVITLIGDGEPIGIYEYDDNDQAIAGCEEAGRIHQEGYHA